MPASAPTGKSEACRPLIVAARYPAPRAITPNAMAGGCQRKEKGGSASLTAQVVSDGFVPNARGRRAEQAPPLPLPGRRCRRRPVDTERERGELHLFPRLVAPVDVLGRIGVRLVRGRVVVPRGRLQLGAFRQLQRRLVDVI